MYSILLAESSGGKDLTTFPDAPVPYSVDELLQ
jgi:hypothetical protein